jgi:hypothetical protein
MNAREASSSGPGLLEHFFALLELWRPVFSQERSLKRVKRQALGLVFALGTRTVARVLAATGREMMPWSTEYRLHSRSPWETRDLFGAILPETLQHGSQSEPIVLAIDFTHLVKTGKKIPGVTCMRDPMSPAFHTNLIYGQRFLQITKLCSFHEGEGITPATALPTRSIPVLFEPSPVLRKPGRKATAEEVQQWKVDSRKRASSHHARESLVQVRQDCDAAGAAHQRIFCVMDGSFCNRVFMEKPIDRVELITRCRKDAVLCRLAQPGSGRIYGKETFSPEQIRQDPEIPWQEDPFFHGGAWYPIRYKEAGPVLWQNGAKRRPLRCIVIAPTGYLRTGKKYYRQPAYLLTTDLTTPAKKLIDYYLQRWEIEVNHREEKTTFGVGHAQVRSKQSVARQPAFAVAVYSLLLLAALKAHGPGGMQHYLPPPKWGRSKKRPSLQDIIHLLRAQIDAAPDKIIPLEATCTASAVILKAAA